jgi:uncharacterized protein YidB (DUF937 family)
MGMLDDMMNKLGLSGSHGNLTTAIGELVGGAQGQGLGTLVDQFKAHGLDGVVHSWIGTGANQPITAEQITKVIGADKVNMIASMLKVPPETVSAKLAEYLPQVVDRLTPNGKVPTA